MDQNTSIYSFPALVAADTVQMNTTGVSNFLEAAQKGTEAAAISGFLSIYNTVVDYAGKEAVQAETFIRQRDGQLADFYVANQEVIDNVGFLGSSMLPGTAAVKALKLAQAGKVGGALQRTLGLTASKKDFYFEEAIKQIGKSGGSVTSEIVNAKRAQLAWATADNVLTSTAFELGVVATMNDSPMFDGDNYWDFTKNVLTGAAFGGVVGGVLEHFGARGVFKQAQRKVESSRREFDTVFNPENLGLRKADEILNFAENIVKLPDDFYNTNFEFTWDGKTRNVVLETADAFKSIRNRAERTAFDTLALKFNELAEGAEVTGQAMYHFILGNIQKARKAGRPTEDVLDMLQGYLAGVKRIGAIDEEVASATKPKHFFINREATGLDNLFTEVRAKATSKQAYFLKTQDPTQIKFATLGSLGLKKADDAFKLGYDAVVNAEGRVIINQQSKNIGKMADPALQSKFYIDLETGSLVDRRMFVAADLLRRPEDLKFFKDAVALGRKIFPQAASMAISLQQSPVEIGARFMWASKLKDADFSKRVVEWNDFPLLERMRQLPAANFDTASMPKVRMPDGNVVGMDEIVDVHRMVNDLKLQWLEKELGTQVKGRDLRELSNALNVSRGWVEEAVASGFTQTAKLMTEIQDLKGYFKPQTLMMEWDTSIKQVGTVLDGPVGPNHAATVVLGQHYRREIQKNISKNAADSVLGEDAARFMETEQDLTRLVSEGGAGASMFGASNADYGRKADLFVQEIGKQVALVSQKWRDATITKLAPHVNAIRDNPNAAAELGILTNRIRRDPRKYYLQSADETGGEGARLIDREVLSAMEKDGLDLEEAIAFVQSSTLDEVAGVFKIESDEVVQFLRANMEVNAARINKHTTLLNASGISRTIDPRVVYVPPVDTSRYPNFAFVVAKKTLGAATDVTMITAKNDEQLRKLAQEVGDDYEVVYKNDVKKFKEAQGIYDYSAQINESRVNSALQRRGILGDFFPETRAENVLGDYVRWNANSEDNLVRTAVQVKNRQFFAELGFLSEQFQAASLSAAKGLGVLKRRVVDPYDDYRKTALNISKQAEYPVLESFNEFVDKVGTTLYENLDRLWETARGTRGKDLASFTKANELMEQYGLNMPYKSMEDYLVANEKFPRNLIREGFQKVNLWLATTVLRLDFANSLVNIISTPIMIGTEVASIKALSKKDPALVGVLNELMTVQVPGQAQRIPSTTKLIGQAVKNYFGDNKAALIQRYRDNGDIKDVSQLFHEVLDDLAYRPGRKISDWQQKVDAAIEKGSTITGNNFSEEFTRFVSADVMRQMTEPLVQAGRIGVKEQNAFISSFVNRVQGNYIASQRPIVFQGTTGAAVGLFQTYAFNVLQQLFRHVENRNTRALLTFGGLQTSIYGMNGLPFFDAINQHLIGSASSNPEHKDMYSLLPAANKELGEWLLYGTASAFPLFGEKMPALYSRGDMNPRHLSIVPVNPLDIPAVQASIKLVENMVDFGKKVGNGADLSDAALQALEHHGWNRPLAGFAQVLAGQSTTSKGSLISASNELETTSMLMRLQERMIDFGGVARMMGAKPMDEAVALTTLYRSKAYQAMDRARLDALGEAVKTKLENNQMPDEAEMEDLMDSYVRAGGRIETFSSSLQRWSRDANSSIVNQMATKLSSPYGKTMQMIMGGEPLEDYNSLAESE